HLMDCPVYPVLCHWSHRKAAWSTAETIHPQPDEPRDVFINRCINACYTLLQQGLHDYTYQWGGWLDVHHELQPPAMDKNGSSGNADDDVFLQGYMPFALEGQTFLIHRMQGTIHPV